MRRRLIVVFLVPMTLVLLLLAAAYGWTLARATQQQAISQQLGDVGFFLTGARQALRAEEPSLIQNELRRYAELYDADAAVYDRSGALWASSGVQPGKLGEDRGPLIQLALDGRRSEPADGLLTWASSDSTVVEPVVDDGTVIGAVVVVNGTSTARTTVLAQWAGLAGFGALVVVALVWAVFRLASWVLRPLHHVDEAMAAIEAGEMDARIADDTGPPEVRRMVRLFNQMAAELERVVSRQQEFVMNASHELRNPLGALLLRVETLATGLDKSWDSDVEQVREEGRRMTQILDTLLRLARGGKTNSVFVVCDLGELASERIEAWSQRAAEQGISLRQGPSPMVLAATDRIAVQSALDVLIDNALKFAPAGTAVEITLYEDDALVLLTVRDHGPGLPPEEIEQASNRFWRSSRDQQLPGSGLGLAIASDLMTELGGELLISAPAGGGLEVTLVFPGRAA